MVLNTKEMDYGMLYQFCEGLGTGTWYVTKLRNNKLFGKPMIMVYQFDDEGKINSVSKGYLVNEDWGEPEFRINGWQISKDSNEEAFSQFGDPKTAKELCFAVINMHEANLSQVDLLNIEIQEFYNNPIEYFNKSRLSK